MNGSANVCNKKTKEQILNNCLTDKKTGLVGVYRGYYITVDFMASNYQMSVIINANGAYDANNAQLNNWLQNNRNNLKDITNVSATTNMVILNMKIPMLGKKIPEIINYNVEYVINVLSSNGYVTGCGSCGTSNKAIDCYEINGNHRFLCNDCVANMEMQFQQHQQNMVNKESDIVKGTIGAVLGSIAGVILWILIYKAGYIAAIAGFVIALGALKGYEKLGKNLNKKGVISSIIVIVIMVWLANRISCALDVYDGLSIYGNYSFMDCFTNLIDILDYVDAKGDYYLNLAMGYVLTIAGSYKIIAQALINSTGKYSIKKS